MIDDCVLVRHDKEPPQLVLGICPRSPYLFSAYIDHFDLGQQGERVGTDGTALDLFWFDVPRLSVGIDLNYIGQVEHPKTEVAIQAVRSREGFKVARMPPEHAGSKWRLRYENGISADNNLAVDVSFILRLPL